MILNEIQGNIVAVRVCYDLPTLTDIARIEDSKDTILQLLAHNNSVVLLSHWGRPNGADAKFSMLQMQQVVSEILGCEVEYINQYDFFEKQLSLRDIIKVSRSKVFLLENTRFDPREQSQNPLERHELAQNYADVCDVFVDEAFAVSHRQEATNTELAQLKGRVLGFSFEHEVAGLTKLVFDTASPFVVVMGGSKLETKIPLMQAMCEKADVILVAGEIALPFLAAKGGVNLGDLVIPEVTLAFAQKLMETYPDTIVVPDDIVMGELGGKMLPLDIGSKTIEKYKVIVQTAKKIFWNGPLGYYEQKPYDTSTLELGEIIADLKDVYRVIGGGDTISALPKNVQEKFDFVSMGGGATLEFLTKK
jgi:phosphoglycerate kinase